ncbi:MAG: tetratricopeptide repeat protein, partial [Magnetococcales bacterium]|nr:tetratricopeptide repeat protein [Magnetococcales bacterium]
MDSTESEQQQRLVDNPNSDNAQDALHKAISFHRAGQLSEAIHWYKKNLTFNPNDTTSLSNMGAALQSLGRLQEAVTCYKQGIAINPDYANNHSNLGVALQELGQLDQAISCMQKATTLKTDFADAYSNLGDVLREKGELEDAVISCKKAIAIKPDFAQAYSNLGIAYQEQGKFEKAIESYRKAIAILPDYTICHNNLICCLDLFSQKPDDLFQTERIKWAEQHAAPLKVHWPSFTSIPDPEKKLRIGYVGSDFKNHSAAHIFGPMLLNYDTEKFQVFCYVGNKVVDGFTRSFKEKATHWLPAWQMDDETLAKEIKNDGIDILVDLAGHTTGNRLLAFARKPAPIQLTAWGYPLGTAMEAMDYILADPIVIPLSERKKYTEQILDISCVIQATPTIKFPEITELPFTKNGYITFGAFNRVEKYNQDLYK